jgi:uncharacterized protein (TIGR02217 family)
MTFHNSAIFPTDVSYGSSGGPGYNTSVITLDSGHEIRTERWSQPRHQYDISYGIRTFEQLQTVIEFFHARSGSAHGFRYLDPLDHSTDSTRRGTAAWDDINLGTLTADATTIQLATQYTNGGITKSRTIEKPIADTVKVGWDDGGGLLEKTETTDWTIDNATGIVTITGAAYAGAEGKDIWAGCQFHTPTRFGEGVDKALMVSVDAFETGGLSSIPLIEIKSANEQFNEFDMGGVSLFTAAAADANYSLTQSDGRVAYCQASGSYDINLTLPTLTNNMKTGGPWYYVFHAGGTGDVVILSGETVIQTLSQDEGTVIIQFVSGAGVRTWARWGGA